MLYLVGLGLGEVTDVTVRGLEVIRKANRVYLEAYTSILGGVNIQELVIFINFILFHIYLFLTQEVHL